MNANQISNSWGMRCLLLFIESGMIYIESGMICIYSRWKGTAKPCIKILFTTGEGPDRGQKQKT